MRRFLLMNDAHPVLDVFVGLLSDPTQNKDFFEAIFRTARKYPDEFQAAIRLVGDMTHADDGRLSEILAATVRIFSKFAATGVSGGPIRPQEVPVLDAARLRSHSWSKTDLVTVAPQILPEWRGCIGLSPTIRLDRYSSAGFENDFANYMECLNSDNKHREIVDDVFLYLKVQKTNSGKPLLYHWIDSLRGFEVSPNTIRELLKSFFDLYDEGTLFQAVDVLPWWLNYDFSASRTSTKETLVSPLIELIGNLMRREPASVLRFEKFFGQLIQSDSMPGAVSFLRKLSIKKPSVTPFVDHEGFSKRPFIEPLWQYECIDRSSAQDQRISQLIHEYRNSVTGWQLDSKGDLRFSWSKTDIQAELAPIAKKLGDPTQGPLGARLLDFMRMSSLQPGAQPDQARLQSWVELRNWLKERSNDWEVIPYFYPGEESPRLKMVSSLDLFELLVINADFNVVLPENYALKFLGLMAQAWGDEPRRLWPEDIQKRFPGERRPQTLREAFDEIKKTQALAQAAIGFPDLPDCPRGKTGQHGISLVPLDLKARVFNMAQLLPVIERNLPDSHSQYRGGMKVFRNLLYQMWASTPEKDRDACDGWKSNLSVAPALAKLGMFRQLARAVRLTQLPENQGERSGSEVLDHVIEGLVSVSIQNSAASALDSLFRNDPKNEFFLS
ncbi:MAG: hypothetical protein KGQ59_06845, partial [Bdellovibrionales bacterium]|nr:hypothetical protein [Bdellovibrionales bacterium]